MPGSVAVVRARQPRMWRNGRTVGPAIGRPHTPSKHLQVDATAPLWALTDWFRVHGCLNPEWRARELVRSGVCRFYRVEDDSVVTVTALDAHCADIWPDQWAALCAGDLEGADT